MTPEINNIHKYARKPRHKWFSNVSPDAPDSWFGPCESIELAFIECLSNDPVDSVFVAQGRKLSKKRIDEMCVDYTWEVDTKNLLEIKAVKNEQIKNEMR